MPPLMSIKCASGQCLGASRGRRPAKINRSKSIVAFGTEVVAAIEAEAEAAADVVMSPGVVERLPEGAYTSLLEISTIILCPALFLSLCPSCCAASNRNKCC